MLADCNIRKATHEDIPRLINLLNVLFSLERDFKTDDAKQRIGLELMLNDNNRCIMVAEADHHIVGMCTAQIIISTAEGGNAALIEDVVIDQDYRAKGIGKALLESLGHWAGEKNAKRLQLLADRDNTPALAFYEALGWHTTHLICLHKK